MAVETVCRVWNRLLPISATETLIFRRRSFNILRLPWRHSIGFPSKSRIQGAEYRAPSLLAAAGWLSGFGEKKKPDIVKAGDPVLHEPAADVPLQDIGSERIQKIIDDMITAMRKAPGVGLAAPQIGVPLKSHKIFLDTFSSVFTIQAYRPPMRNDELHIVMYMLTETIEVLQIIVLEDTKEYISYAPRKDIEAQDRRPFDLLVILNPKLKKKGTKTALFFEGCLSVDGFRALVERHLEVEVTGLDRDGCPIKLDAVGWQARILQHEFDHLDGTIYVDKMVPRTFRTVENLDLPLPVGCPPLGVQ